jgi:hypothetical protein
VKDSDAYNSTAYRMKGPYFGECHPSFIKGWSDFSLTVTVMQGFVINYPIHQGPPHPVKRRVRRVRKKRLYDSGCSSA